MYDDLQINHNDLDEDFRQASNGLNLIQALESISEIIGDSDEITPQNAALINLVVGTATDGSILDSSQFVPATESIGNSKALRKMIESKLSVATEGLSDHIKSMFGKTEDNFSKLSDKIKHEQEVFGGIQERVNRSEHKDGKISIYLPGTVKINNSSELLKHVKDNTRKIHTVVEVANSLIDQAKNPFFKLMWVKGENPEFHTLWIDKINTELNSVINSFAAKKISASDLKDVYIGRLVGLPTSVEISIPSHVNYSGFKSAVKSENDSFFTLHPEKKRIAEYFSFNVAGTGETFGQQQEIQYKSSDIDSIFDEISAVQSFTIESTKNIESLWGNFGKVLMAIYTLGISILAWHISVYRKLAFLCMHIVKEMIKLLDQVNDFNMRLAGSIRSSI